VRGRVETEEGVIRGVVRNDTMSAWLMVPF